MRCDLKTLNECPRPCITRCAVQPQTTPTPVPRFTVRDQLMVCAFIGVVAGFIFYGAASRADEHYRIQALDQQEVTANAYRR